MVIAWLTYATDRGARMGGAGCSICAKIETICELELFDNFEDLKYL